MSECCSTENVPSQAFGCESKHSANEELRVTQEISFFGHHYSRCNDFDEVFPTESASKAHVISLNWEIFEANNMTPIIGVSRCHFVCCCLCFFSDTTRLISQFSDFCFSLCKSFQSKDGSDHWYFEVSFCSWLSFFPVAQLFSFCCLTLPVSLVRSGTLREQVIYPAKSCGGSARLTCPPYFRSSIFYSYKCAMKEG